MLWVMRAPLRNGSRTRGTRGEGNGEYVAMRAGRRCTAKPAGRMAAHVILTILRWFRIWRWPAGLVAGVVLWIALVAVVGATTRPAVPAGEHPADMETTVAPAAALVVGNGG